MALTDNLLAYWPLDSQNGNLSLTDASLHGRNLTGTATLTSGKIGNGAAFLQKPSSYGSTSIGLSGLTITSDWTVSFWFKIASDWDTGGDPLVIFQTSSPSQSNVSTRFSAGDGCYLAINFYAWETDPARLSLTTNVWYHCAVRRTSGQDVQENDVPRSWTNVDLFLNGTVISSTPFDYNNAPPTLFPFDVSGISFQSEVGSGGASVSLDEIGLWSRALSNEEIASLYNSGNGVQLLPLPNVNFTLLGATSSLILSRAGDLQVDATGVATVAQEYTCSTYYEGTADSTLTFGSSPLNFTTGASGMVLTGLKKTRTPGLVSYLCTYTGLVSPYYAATYGSQLQSYSFTTQTTTSSGTAPNITTTTVTLTWTGTYLSPTRTTYRISTTGTDAGTLPTGSPDVTILTRYKNGVVTGDQPQYMASHWQWQDVQATRVGTVYLMKETAAKVLYLTQ